MKPEITLLCKPLCDVCELLQEIFNLIQNSAIMHSNVSVRAEMAVREAEKKCTTH